MSPEADGRREPRPQYDRGDPARVHVRALARESPHDPTGWFERLYAQAARGEAAVPWDRPTPSHLLTRWADEGVDGRGRTAIVVGAGYGQDAELVAGLGFATTAFDVSPSSVRQVRARFPGSSVEHVVADLLDLPEGWREHFDLVVEAKTVQSLPERLRADAVAAVRSMLAPGGTLLVVAVARDEGPPPDGPPWPLTAAHVAVLAAPPLRPRVLQRLPDPADPDLDWWWAVLTRDDDGVGDGGGDGAGAGAGTGARG